MGTTSVNLAIRFVIVSQKSQPNVLFCKDYIIIGFLSLFIVFFRKIQFTSEYFFLQDFAISGFCPKHFLVFLKKKQFSSLLCTYKYYLCLVCHSILVGPLIYYENKTFVGHGKLRWIGTLLDLWKNKISSSCNYTDRTYWQWQPFCLLQLFSSTAWIILTTM